MNRKLQPDSNVLRIYVLQAIRKPLWEKVALHFHWFQKSSLHENTERGVT